jgi:hypothetical protein
MMMKITMIMMKVVLNVKPGLLLDHLLLLQQLFISRQLLEEGVSFDQEVVEQEVVVVVMLTGMLVLMLYKPLNIKVVEDQLVAGHALGCKYVFM